jgi:hypothetical protein
MLGLVGRLTELDPAEGEGLKVISHFDLLVSSHVGVDAFLRSAAALGGCPAGLADGSGRPLHRFQPDGTPLPNSGPMDNAWPRHRVGDREDVWVWLEREGEAHANDEILLERLAFGIGIARERIGTTAPDSSMLPLLDPEVALDDRNHLALRLRIDRDSLLRVVATPITAAARQLPRSGVIFTEVGPVLAVIGNNEALQRAGIGFETRIGGLPESWSSALTALRLTTPTRPILNADDLGGLLLLPKIAEETKDVVAIARAADDDPAALITLDALSETSTSRSAAMLLGIHHSTLQARVVALTQRLAFNPSSPLGRTRLTIALCQFRLLRTQFLAD